MVCWTGNNDKCRKGEGKEFNFGGLILIPLLVLLRSPISPVRSLLQHSLPISPVLNLRLASSRTSPVLLLNLQASPAAPPCWMTAPPRTPLKWKWQRSLVESSNPFRFSPNLCRPRQSGPTAMTTAIPTPTRTVMTTTNWQILYCQKLLKTKLYLI